MNNEECEHSLGRSKRHTWTERWSRKLYLQKNFCVYTFFGMYNLSKEFGYCPMGFKFFPNQFGFVKALQIFFWSCNLYINLACLPVCWFVCDNNVEFFSLKSVKFQQFFLKLQYIVIQVHTKGYVHFFYALQEILTLNNPHVFNQTTFFA